MPGPGSLRTPEFQENLMQTTPAIPEKRSWLFRGWNRQTRRSFWTGMAFIAPWILGFLFFTVYPMAASLFYSFSIYHVRQPLEWIGLGNYASLFTDTSFWKALGNTAYMVVFGVPLTLLLSFTFAVLLNVRVRGQSVYRVIYFLPSIVPTVASTMLWLWILNPSTGILNAFLGLIGIDGPNWLRDPNWSKPSLILLLLWGMGGTIVIYLSGLQDVPQALLEAAELDGAGWWRRLWHITLPMVSPITVFALITGVISMFQYFAQAYVFAFSQGTTGSGSIGSPLNSTLFYSVYLYQSGFIYLKMGYASAMAWILFFIIMGCTVLMLRLSNRFAYYSS
jgi:multiple sugar transport system permease protein